MQLTSSVPLTRRSMQAFAVAISLGKLTVNEVNHPWVFCGETRKGYSFKNVVSGEWLFV